MHFMQFLKFIPLFKGIPEGHFSCAFTFSSASVFGPSVGISEISVFVKISSSLPSYKLSSELSYMISSSEFNSTSISLRSGGSSPLYILRPSSYLLNQCFQKNIQTEIAGSYGSSIFNILKKLHTVVFFFVVVAPIYISTSKCTRVSFYPDPC